MIKRVIRLHFKPILNPMYDIDNVATCPIVTTYPMLVFFTRNTCPSKTLAHKAVLNPSLYTIQVFFIFLLCQFPVVAGHFWRTVNCRKCIFKITQRGKSQFLAITVSYCRISSPNFACRIGLICFSYDITENSCCLLVFEKTQL